MTHSKLRPPPALLGLPRLLTQAVPPLSLACLAMTLSPVPAHAGSWTFSCTDGSTASGGSSATSSESYDFYGQADFSTSTTPWTPPASASGVSYYQIPSFGYYDNGFSSIGQNGSRTEDVSITAKITMTWVPDSSLPSDPAPPSLWLIESSNAQAVAQYQDGTPGTYYGNATADDGIGDAPVTTTANGVTSGVYSRSSTSSVPPQPPPPHWFQQKVSGNTASFTRTFSAHADATLPNDLSQGAMDISCVAGGYTVAIHAQPYGWYDAGHLENGVFVAGPHMDNTTGELAFSYGWLSTSGNLSDLKNITIYEIVDYSGNPGTMSADKTTFYPQSPPVTSGYNPPNGKAGTPYDASQLYAHDVHSAFPTVSPLQPLAALTWTIPQKYEFDDPATGEKGTVLKDEGNIVDMLKINPNQFTVSKSGFTATKPL